MSPALLSVEQFDTNSVHWKIKPQLLWHLCIRDNYCHNNWGLSDQIRSVAQSCPTLCDPMNRSTPCLPVHHQLPEFTQTHVHRVSDACQPSHPLSSPSPPAPNPFQYQSFPMGQLFAWGGQSTGVSALASFLPKKSQGWSPSEWVGWISLQSKGLSRVFSNTTVQKHQYWGLYCPVNGNTSKCRWDEANAWLFMELLLRLSFT